MSALALSLSLSARAAVTNAWGRKPQTVMSRFGRPGEVGGWEACSDVLVRALLLACTQRLLAVSSWGRAGDRAPALWCRFLQGHWSCWACPWGCIETQSPPKPPPPGTIAPWLRVAAQESERAQFCSQQPDIQNCKLVNKDWASQGDG